jgi:uncharacterized protein YjbJ (UPF0337 family)
VRRRLADGRVARAAVAPALWAGSYGRKLPLPMCVPTAVAKVDAWAAIPAASNDKEHGMNEDRTEGNWKQFKGKVKEQWGKLTDDDLDVIAGRRDQLAGKIQERHGVAKDEAERQIRDYESRNPDCRFR